METNVETLLPEALMTATEVAEFINCSRSQVDRMALDGRIPRPIKFGEMQRWVRAAVVACVAGQQS